MYQKKGGGVVGGGGGGSTQHGTQSSGSPFISLSSPLPTPPATSRACTSHSLHRPAYLNIHMVQLFRDYSQSRVCAIKERGASPQSLHGLQHCVAQGTERQLRCIPSEFSSKLSEVDSEGDVGGEGGKNNDGNPGLQICCHVRRCCYDVKNLHQHICTSAAPCIPCMVEVAKCAYCDEYCGKFHNYRLNKVSSKRGPEQTAARGFGEQRAACLGPNGEHDSGEDGLNRACASVHNAHNLPCLSVKVEVEVQVQSV